jgi:hypothetical protein
MELLKVPMPSRVGPGATAGWIEDRDIGYSPQQISLALRKLCHDKLIVKSSDGGLVYWQVLTPEVAAQIRKRKTRFVEQRAT